MSFHELLQSSNLKQRTLGIRTLILVVSVLMFSVQMSASTVDDKYYSLHSLMVGPLSVRSLTVRDVRIIGSDESSHTETVDLNIVGVMTLYCSAKPCISGEIVPSSSTIRILGDFKWVDSKITSINVKTMNLGLREWTLNIPIGEGILKATPDFSMKIVNTTPLGFKNDGAEGHLRLTIARAYLASPVIKLADLALSLERLDTRGLLLDLDLQSGTANVQAGHFLSSGPTVVPGERTSSQFFPNHRFIARSITLGEIDIDSALSSLSISHVLIDASALDKLDSPGTSIVAVAGIREDNAHAKVLIGAGAFESKNFDTPTIRVVPDPSAVIKQLNKQWVGDQDSLLPTGDSSVRYIRLSALSALYKDLAKSDRELSASHRIYLTLNSDVVTGTSEETIPISASARLDPTPKVCLIFDGAVAEGVATVAVTYLLNMAIPGSAFFKPSYAAMLVASTRMAPVFGMPAFYTVLGTTKVLTATAGNATTKFITNAAKQSCEMLLGHGSTPRVVQLPDPVDSPGQTYSSQMQSRYRQYIKARTDAGLSIAPVGEGRVFSLLQDESQARAELNNVSDLRATAWMTKHSEDVAALRSAEAAYAESLVVRQSEVRSQNASSASTAARQAEEHAARERAVANTPIIAMPAPGSDSRPLKTYIISTPGSTPH